LNVAGTIAGAAVASVVSTIGSALYQNSIERTRASVRRVGSKAWVVKPVDGETASEAEAGSPAETEVDTADKTSETRRWPRIAVGAVLVFVLGMLAVTGVEWVRGAPLSGGTEGTSLGAVVGKPTAREDAPPAGEVTSTQDTPSTTTPPPSTTSGPPTTTTGSTPSSSAPQSSSPPPSTTGQSSSETTGQTTPAPPTSLGTTG
jgi:cytoskeletal protein RodZ